MSLEKALSLVSATLVALVLAIAGWVVLSDEKRLLDEAKNAEITTTGLVLSTIMDQAATLSASHAESIARDPTVARLLLEGKRDELQAYSKPEFDRLKSAAGVDVLHFHTAGLASFLRVHDPEKFGEDLSQTRLMIVSANRRRQTQKGLELGITGLSLRAVAPIEGNSSVAGTVEVGVDLASLVELAKAATGAEFALYLDSSKLAARDEEASAAVGQLRPVATTNRELSDRLLGEGRVRVSREGYVEDLELGGRTLALMGRPLLDYSGNLIGTIVVTRDFSAIQSYHTRSTVTVWGVSLCGFLVVFAVLMVILRALVTRPLSRLAAACDEDGDGPARTGGFQPIEDIGAKVDALKRQIALARGTGA